MDINNVVLVRAMNNLPLNGELIPSCEGKRLVKDELSDFYYFMRDSVEINLEKKLGRTLNMYNPQDCSLVEDVMKDYTPLTGDYYTTTLSFALNGLVPDDINNKFTNMKIAVLEPLKNQIDADFVTIETIDTTIKGRMKTSDEAILVIEREFFSQLSSEIQVDLMENYKIKLFDGCLKDAISNTLIENNYPVLPLIQQTEIYNIEDCPEKESMLDFEDKFSEMVGASRLRLHFLTFMYGGGTSADINAHNKIAEEHDYSLIVTEYYKNKLHEFMLNKAEELGIEISDRDKYYLFSEGEESVDIMKKIVSSLINAYGGIGNFKQFIQEYNKSIEENYVTNQEIVSSINNKQKN